MVIGYEFIFKTKNGLYADIISRISKSDAIRTTVVQSDNGATLYAEGTEELLHEYFEQFGKRLPIMLQLRSAAVKHASSFPEFNEEISGHEDFGGLFVNFEAAKQLLTDSSPNYFNPHLDVCSFAKPTMQASEKARFIECAKAINDGKSVLLCSVYGTRVFKKLCNKNLSSQSTEPTLMLCDTAEIYKVANISEQEFVALSSCERPLMRLASSEINDFKDALAYPNLTLYKLSDDTPSLLLCRALQEAGEVAVMFEECDENHKADIILDFGFKPVRKRELKEVLSVNDLNIFVNKSSEDIALLAREKLSESGVDGEKAIVAYMSLQNDKSGFYAYENGTLSTVFTFSQIPQTSQQIFEEFRSSSDSFSKVAASLEAKYPALLADILGKKLTAPDGLPKLFEFLALFLGFKQDKNLALFLQDQGYLSTEANGIRLDMKIAKQDGVLAFEWQKLAGSFFSFLLASAEPQVMAFSLLQSLSEFLVTYITGINENFKAQNLCLCGELFYQKTVTQKTAEKLRPVFTIHI